jgi:hypothetical protein
MMIDGQRHVAKAYLGLPEGLRGWSGLKLLRTASNMVGQKDCPTSIPPVAFTFFFRFVSIGSSSSNLTTNLTNA